jgi:hypothetical protein
LAAGLAAGAIEPAGWAWVLVIASLAAALIVWLSLLPGSVLLDYFVSVSNPGPTVSSITLAAFGVLLTIFAGFAYDIQRQTGVQPTSAVSG